MEKTRVLMCSGLDNRWPVEGSVKGKCEVCGAGVWIAPTGIAMVKAGDTMVYCNPCGFKSVEKTNGTIEPPLPEQVEELIRQDQIDKDRIRGN